MDVKIISELNKLLVGQAFDSRNDSNLEQYGLLSASVYANVEGAIAVLSNMKDTQSTIFYGTLGERLGIEKAGKVSHISTIWEEEILSHVMEEDLISKQLQELKFFRFLMEKPKEERRHYCLESGIRMKTANGKQLAVTHRIFYFAQRNAGTLHFSLCIYSLSSDGLHPNRIINTATGESISLQESDFDNPLSDREKEVLHLIDLGMRSKEIADRLFISINTVNRHRQNILGKLNVGNSVEACSLAKKLRLI